MLRRMLGAARLNVDVYEEVEADRPATFQAFLVVVLVALATGVGSLSAGGGGGLISGVIFGLASWGIWAFITYLIGTTIFRTPETEADWGQLLKDHGIRPVSRDPPYFRLYPGNRSGHLLCHVDLAACRYGGGGKAGPGLQLYVQGYWGRDRGVYRGSCHPVPHGFPVPLVVLLATQPRGDICGFLTRERTRLSLPRKRHSESALVGRRI